MNMFRLNLYVTVLYSRYLKTRKLAHKREWLQAAKAFELANVMLEDW